MKTTKWLWLYPLVALFYIYGCSSTTDNPAGGPNGTTDDNGGSSGAGSSGASGGAASSGGASSSGASSGAASGGQSSSGGSSGSAANDGGLTTTDGAPQDDPDIDYSVAPVTLTMTPFTIESGQEVYYCQNFANPWGKQVDIKTYSLNMGTGSHHMFAFYQTNATDGAVGPCPNGGLQFGAFTFVSQSPKKTVNFPATVGATIPATTGFQLMVHYLNTSGAAITSSVALKMYVAKTGAVTQHAGCLFLNNATLTVAPTCTGVGCPSTDNYTLPQDVNILSTEGHMHKFATNFVTTVSPASGLPNGQMYQTNQWSEPEQEDFATPLHLAKGTKITWTCTDVNTTGGLLTFGESAQSNVMCISQSIFYPVTDYNNPVLPSGPTGFGGF
jgi:hypothetical protein